MILTDLHSIIHVPSPEEKSWELRFFHASLPDFLLDRSRSKDLFLDQGVAYAKLTGLAMKHINNLSWKVQSSIHRIFRQCCVKARPSPKLLEDLCGLNLAAHIVNHALALESQSEVTIPELMCWFGRQRLSPDGTETLLDHHLATFDGWLRKDFMPLFASSGSHCYLAIVTLLDQLDPKDYSWERVSVILEKAQLLDNPKLRNLFGGTEENIQFSRIVSKFLMAPERARFFRVILQYVDLARYILDFLRDKRFVNIFDVLAFIPLDPFKLVAKTTYYVVGKLAFKLLRILLSRVKALGGSQVHKVAVLLQSYPVFSLIKNDPLELEKVKVAQAIEEFLEKEGDVESTSG